MDELVPGFPRTPSHSTTAQHGAKRERERERKERERERERANNTRDKRRGKRNDGRRPKRQTGATQARKRTSAHDTGSETRRGTPTLQREETNPTKRSQQLQDYGVQISVQ